MSRQRRNFSAKFKSDLVIELLKGEKDLNTLATENNIQPNLNILVTGNLDSGILETDIPEEGNSLIGLFTTYQVVRYCQAQSRFAVL